MTILGPICQAPDDLMEIPIADLVAKAGRRAERLAQFTEMLGEGPSAAPLGITATRRRAAIRVLLEREATLCRVAAVALRVRAREVCRFCSAIGLKSCTPQRVRDAPLQTALAARQHQQHRRGRHGY